MYKSIFLAVTCLLTAALFSLAMAQNGSEETSVQLPQRPDCSSTDYRAFDFWIGEWVVYSGDEKAGENSIRASLDGCVLQENWRGAIHIDGGSQGTSLNYYDRADQSWHQVWVDASGGVLNLAGGLNAEGQMVLSGIRPAPRSSAADRTSGTMEHRITWTPKADGTVNQHWQSRTGDDEWQTLFNGEYRPQNPASTTGPEE